MYTLKYARQEYMFIFFWGGYVTKSVWRQVSEIVFQILFWAGFPRANPEMWIHMNVTYGGGTHSGENQKEREAARQGRGRSKQGCHLRKVSQSAALARSFQSLRCVSCAAESSWPKAFLLLHRSLIGQGLPWTPRYALCG